MQSFNFGLRHSAAPSMDDNRSRYIPSSIYSGPGPAEESPMTVQLSFGQHGQNGTSPYLEIYPEYTPVTATKSHPRYSSLLNTNDPVAMHLLMETAIIDSKSYEILSFEELEQAKKERTMLSNKLEGFRRQLALEIKMRDAAQSLNRLYSTSGGNNNIKSEGLNAAPQIRRKSLLGNNRSSSSEALGRTDEEINASNRKVAQLSDEISSLAKRFEEIDRRIMQHTAGVLQITHRGLKKNLRKNELPRSPESMASRSRRSLSNSHDFDERSLYQVPDYIHNFSQLSTPMLHSKKANSDTQAIDDVAHRLHDLSQKLHTMVLDSGPHEHFEAPPEPNDETLMGRVGAQIQAYLNYVSQGLDAIAMARERNGSAAAAHLELDDFNSYLQEVLEKTASVGQSPLMAQDVARGNDIQSQLAFSSMMLDRLNGRVDNLVEQKDILTRQIQQQRELNSKSDAQRDAQIRDLMEELGEAKQLQTMAEQEVSQSQNQIGLLMEQLDRVKQDEVLHEQQRGLNDGKALEAERQARKEMERSFMSDLQDKQDAHTQLQADHAKVQNDFELRSQQHIQQVNELETRLTQLQLDHDEAQNALGLRSQEHSQKVAELESQLAQLQSHHDTAQRETEIRSQDHFHQIGELENQLAQLQSHYEKSKSDIGQRSQEHSDRVEELEHQLAQLQAQLETSEQDIGSRTQEHSRQVDDLKSQLAELQAQHDESKEHIGLRSQEHSRQVGDLESRLVEVQANHTNLQNEIELLAQQHAQRVGELETRSASYQAEYTKLKSDHGLHTQQHLQQVTELESQVIQLQTELTVAKAELDGAYGSRAQRAADVSMNPAIQREIDNLKEQNEDLVQQLAHLQDQHETKGVGSAELQNKVNALQKELKETIEDYEVMTKASIESEKERDQLEAKIDTMRDRCEALETQVSEEKLKWLGVRDKTPLETTSTMVLKNEFKKMMRDSRSESLKVIRAEQDERKRLEAIIRGMKREIGQMSPKPLPRLPTANGITTAT